MSLKIKADMMENPVGVYDRGKIRRWTFLGDFRFPLVYKIGACGRVNRYILKIVENLLVVPKLVCPCGPVDVWANDIPQPSERVEE